MKELTVDEMQRLQRELHEAYGDDWAPLCPDQAIPSFLWMLGEAGEVIDVMKKEGIDAVIHDPDTHAFFTEEVCDVLMYLMDTMLCLSVTPEEIADAFRQKQQKNLHRWKEEE